MEWLLDVVLRPRGKPIPVGEHLADEGSYLWSADPEPHLTIKFPLCTSDDEPLGSYLAVADSRTRFVVDGMDVTMDRAQEAWGDYRDFMRLVVDEPGRLAVLEFDTSERPHA